MSGTKDRGDEYEMTGDAAGDDAGVAADDEVGVDGVDGVDGVAGCAGCAGCAGGTGRVRDGYAGREVVLLRLVAGGSNGRVAESVRVAESGRRMANDAVTLERIRQWPSRALAGPRRIHSS